MIVRIKTAIAAADWSYAPEQVVDIDEKTAKAWIASGIAEAVAEKPKKGAK